MVRRVVVVLAVLGSAIPSAFGQDFGVEWMDRVTRQMEQERAPLSLRPLDLRFFAGERVYYDQNIYLTEHGKKDDTVFITYGNLRLDYAEENFDAALDLQANYNHYVHEDDARDDEERFYGRARWAGTEVQVEVAEVFRRESDPYIDPEVVERVERLVSNTFPRVTVWVTDVVSLEANANIQVVRFEDDLFEHRDNQNYRVGLLGAYELPSGVQIVLDGGYLRIDYRHDPTDAEHPGPADVQGAYLRGGFRGEIQPRIFLSLLIGPTYAASERVEELHQDSERYTTGDVEMNMRFEASEKTSLFFDYARRVGFGAWESFQIVNRVGAGLEYAATEKLKILLRGQYDYVRGIDDWGRSFGSVSVGTTYSVLENLILDAAATYREADLERHGSDYATDAIFSAGAAMTF